MMTMGKATWDLQKHIDELRKWETSHNTYQGFNPFQPKQSLSQGVPMDIDKKKSTTVCTQNLPKLTPSENLTLAAPVRYREKQAYGAQDMPVPAGAILDYTIV